MKEDIPDDTQTIKSIIRSSVSERTDSRDTFVNTTDNPIQIIVYNETKSSLVETYLKFYKYIIHIIWNYFYNTFKNFLLHFITF